MKPGGAFLLELHPERAIGDSPAEVRLRAFLKEALRRWGFRCVWFAEVPDDAQEGTPLHLAPPPCDPSEKTMDVRASIGKT